MLLDVGGTRILITHGEHDDPFNQIDYAALLSVALGQAETHRTFQYPAGSLLMRNIVGPLRRKYGLRFLDYLKPDFQGAVLAALAVVPEACAELFHSTCWDIAWQLLRSSRAGVPFSAQSPQERELGLAARIDDCDLSESEREELLHCISADDSEVSFSTQSLRQEIRSKLLRSGLSLYAQLHRAAASRAGGEFFDLAPGPQESAWATALGERHGASAVLTGHTHAARFLSTDRQVYINSGTWTWLMRLPAPDAEVDTWSAFLHELRSNPTLDPGHQRLARLERLLTVVSACPRLGGGVRLALATCQQDGELAEVRAAELPPSLPVASPARGDGDV
jgi:hypothetical protein